MNMADYGSRRQMSVGGLSRVLVTALILVLLFFMGACAITKVDTGNVGVLTKFGRVTGDVLPEGIHLVDPLKSSNQLSVRTQEQKETASVPSSEGLIMTLEASLLFHLDKDKAADVYQHLGADYQIKIVEPTMRSAIREATSSHGANALYTGERELVAKEIESNLASQLSARGIVVEKILLRDIQLPESLKRSIELKQASEQESLAMQFKLQKEKQEADRKRIEAQGIKDFQTIVAQGITPGLLEWKGIEATEKFAASPNAKVVIVGNQKNGLPLVLGGS
ncbi:MAG: membrane protease subunit, stomatin/prohibitin [Acidobacteria bacterium]|nr:MAG: membrane protease subunit, stomatin/prohibitin [Acidobacteriota bacterium]